LIQKACHLLAPVTPVWGRYGFALLEEQLDVVLYTAVWVLSYCVERAQVRVPAIREGRETRSEKTSRVGSREGLTWEAWAGSRQEEANRCCELSQ
jgi:hypothetical protein